MQLELLDACFSGIDLTWAYFAACWLGAAGVILEMQKIAHSQVMVNVRAFWRHTVRLLLALLGLTLALASSAPWYYHARPWPSDVVLVSVLALLILAHAAAGCVWARREDEPKLWLPELQGRAGPQA